MEAQEVDQARTWELRLGRRAFAELREQEPFHALVGLARIVNLLRFATGAIACAGDASSPHAKRQQNNAMLMSNALLFEAKQRVLPLVGKYFHDDPAYGELAAWNGDSTVTEFIEKSCKPLRNEAFFHVDVLGIGRRLAQVDNEWVRFVSNRGVLKGFTYFDVADMTAVQTLVGDVPPGGSFDEQFQALLRTSAAATVAFLDAAEALLLQFAQRPEFELNQLPDSVDPACVADKVDAAMKAIDAANDGT